MPRHDFLLLPENEGDYSGWGDHFHDAHAVKLDDDLVLYISDTLKWIPTINPSNPGEWIGYGLNYYGPTVINRTGAAKAGCIFRHWAELLRTGPETLILTGGFEWIEDPATDGGYAVVEFDRESVVKSLQTISEFADQAVGGRFFVLHLGI